MGAIEAMRERVDTQGFTLVEAGVTLAAVALAGLAGLAVTENLGKEVGKQSRRADAVTGFGAVEAVLSKQSLCAHVLRDVKGGGIRIPVGQKAGDALSNAEKLNQLVFPDLKDPSQVRSVLARVVSEKPTFSGPIPLQALTLTKSGACTLASAEAELCPYELRLSAATQILDGKITQSTSKTYPLFLTLRSAGSESEILSCTLGAGVDGVSCKEMGGEYDPSREPACLLKSLKIASTFEERNALSEGALSTKGDIVTEGRFRHPSGTALGKDLSVAGAVSAESMKLTGRLETSEKISFVKYDNNGSDLAGWNGLIGKMVSDTPSAEPNFLLQRAFRSKAGSERAVEGYATLGSWITSGYVKHPTDDKLSYESVSAIVTETQGNWVERQNYGTRMHFFTTPKDSKNTVNWSEPSLVVSHAFTRVQNELLIGENRYGAAASENRWDEASNDIFAARIGRDAKGSGYLQLRAPSESAGLQGKETVWISGETGAVHAQKLVPLGESPPTAADEGKLLRLDNQGHFKWGNRETKTYTITINLNPKCGAVGGEKDTVERTTYFGDTWDICSISSQRYDMGGAAVGKSSCRVAQQYASPGKWLIVARAEGMACIECEVTCVRF